MAQTGVSLGADFCYRLVVSSTNLPSKLLVGLAFWMPTGGPILQSSTADTLQFSAAQFVQNQATKAVCLGLRFYATTAMNVQYMGITAMTRMRRSETVSCLEFFNMSSLTTTPAWNRIERRLMPNPKSKSQRSTDRLPNQYRQFVMPYEKRSNRSVERNVIDRRQPH